MSAIRARDCTHEAGPAGGARGAAPPASAGGRRARDRSRPCPSPTTRSTAACRSSTTSRCYAIVSNSVNVRSGDPVRIAGIDVGQVSGVAPGPATRLEDRASRSQSNGAADPPRRHDPDPRPAVPRGELLPRARPGHPRRPDASHDGATIPESQTHLSPVQFFQVLSTFDVATRQSLDQHRWTRSQRVRPPLPASRWPTAAPPG